ncbi:hypothetical protein [Shimia sp. Alg240-R146]|uniref:hypothetical protein n=1 Tax=Shimia sp. Alg240-R146 TaxID=2993449 RepID=UPI0022E1D41C|nr:hypothetical protein [Shimia sp. Alg240-R146]
MNWMSLAIGVVIGGAGATDYSWATQTYEALDHGISLTYCHDEQDLLRKESDVLKAMAEPHWLALSAFEAQSRLEQAGVFDFPKGTSGLAADPVFLVTENGVVTEIQTHCARLHTEDCVSKGDH